MYERCLSTLSFPLQRTNIWTLEAQWWNLWNVSSLKREQIHESTGHLPTVLYESTPSNSQMTLWGREMWWGKRSTWYQYSTSKRCSERKRVISSEPRVQSVARWNFAYSNASWTSRPQSHLLANYSRMGGPRRRFAGREGSCSKTIRSRRSTPKGSQHLPRNGLRVVFLVE